MTDVIPSYTDKEAFLEHYGIPGMRWGKRTSRPSSSKASKKTADEGPDDPDYVATRHTLSKPIRKVSNQELINLNQRLNLEQNYSKIKAQNTPSAKVDKHVKGVIAVAGTIGALYGISQSKWAQSAVEAGKAAINNRKMVRAGIQALVDASTKG